LKSRDWSTRVRDPAFCPKTWFCRMEGWPVMSEGEHANAKAKKCL